MKTNDPADHTGVSQAQIFKDKDGLVLIMSYLVTFGDILPHRVLQVIASSKLVDFFQFNIVRNIWDNLSTQLDKM